MEKKILMITSTSTVGGGPKQLMLLASGLKELYDVSIACPLNGEINRQIPNDISGKSIYIKERKVSVLDIIRLVAFVRKFSIKIIHSHGKGASVLGRLTSFFTGVPLIHTFHGIHINKVPKISRLIYIFYERLTSFIDFYDIFVSKTEFLEASNHNLINNDKFVIIPNGVPNNYLTIDTIKNRIDLRKELQISINRTTVVTLCRLEKVKNLFEFIDIATLCPQYDFIIIGGGNLETNLREYIYHRRLKNIFLAGFIPNPINYLLASDIYLSTSFREGHPISILEAMSIALPVIATDVTGNQDTIIHEKSGFFYDLGNINLAVNYINMLDKDLILRRKLGKEALSKQRKYFSSDTMIANYLKIYSSF